MICPICQVEMIPGTALAQKELSHFEDAEGHKARSCFHTQGKAELVDCLKCPKCGRSEATPEQLAKLQTVGRLDPEEGPKRLKLREGINAELPPRAPYVPTHQPPRSVQEAMERPETTDPFTLLLLDHADALLQEGLVFITAARKLAHDNITGVWTEQSRWKVYERLSSLYRQIDQLGDTIEGLDTLGLEWGLDDPAAHNWILRQQRLLSNANEELRKSLAQIRGPIVDGEQPR